jgi:outer membrane receptor protein involved in Fe transport
MNEIREEQGPNKKSLLWILSFRSLPHPRVSAAVDNLFNREYELPMGGVNFDDFMNSMWMNQIKPLTGRGRSVYLSLTARF